MASDSTISALTLPTAGVGGTYYDMAFRVPVYPSAPTNMVTWRALDNWNNLNVNVAASQGIATGLIWATLTYLLALTPNRKRTTAFHSFMLLGLVFLLIHMMTDMVTSLTPGIQPSSAYTALTSDIADSVWTRHFLATFGASQVTAWFAFVFASTCLWIQSRGLMTGLKVRSPGIYRFVLSYLAFTSVATLSAGMSYSIHQIVTIAKPVTDVYLSIDNGYTFRIAYLVTCTICIGSYSLVSMISVVDIVWKRPTAISGGGAYASALNLVGLLCAQSFAIPVVFCLMQVLPEQTGLVHPEVLLLASVYMILPLGSLFMTVNSSPIPNAETPRTPIFPPSNANSPTRIDRIDSDMALTNRLGLSLSQPTSCVHDGAHIDRELSSIDAMESGEISRRRGEPSARTQAMFSDKESQEKEVVTPETMGR